MRYFVLDTNFILLYLRDSSTALNEVVTSYRLEENDAALIVSVVSIAEIDSLARRRNWGQQKLNALNNFKRRLIIIDINVEDQRLIQTYVDLDVFSIANGRQMGKNDLWIAATAFVTNATLVTSDGDFDHLTTQVQIVKIPLS